MIDFNLQGWYPGKIISCTEKNIAHVVYNAENILYRFMSGKKMLSPEVCDKKILPKLNHPYPPSPTKVKWSNT